MKCNLDLFPYQRKAWRATEKYKVTAMVAGTGSGKTFFGAPWVIIKALTAPRNCFVYAISNDYALFKRTVWAEILNRLQFWGFEEGVDYEKSATQKEIRFLKTGTKIYGGTAEKPESIQGGHCVAIWGDECGLWKKNAWDTMYQRASFRSAPILITTTPYKWNWVKSEIVDPYYAGETDDIKVINVKSIDNPMYPRDQYKKAKNTLPEWKFKMLYHGVFTRPGNVIYEVDLDDIFIDFSKLDVRFNSGNTFVGVDWGWNHPAAAVWITEQDNVYYVYRAWKKSEKTIDQIAELIKNNDAGYRHYCDSADPGNIEYLRQRGVDAVKADKQVLDGIYLVHSFLKEGRLKISSNLEDLKDEMASYSWKTDKNDDPIDKPEKINDDLLDALRYAIFTREQNKPVATMTSFGGRRKDFKI